MRYVLLHGDNLMANTTFSGPVTSQNGFIGAVSGLVTLPTYTVASVPAAAANTAALIYVSDGAAGAAVVAFSDDRHWLRVDTLTVISAA
jgi:hypothetical protein